MTRVALLAAILVSLLGARAVDAHTRSTSYSTWEFRAEGATVRFRTTRLELTRLPFAAGSTRHPAITAYIGKQLRLSAGDVECSATSPPIELRAPEGWALYEWRFACPPGSDRTIESDVLLDVAPSHLHFARVRLAGGSMTERVLTSADRSWLLAIGGGGDAVQETSGTTIPGYIVVGIEHILTGWDHLAFLFALLLLAARLGEVATLVTSFTVAHSVTLSLGAFGVLEPEAPAIEALIGLSIALVALENGWILAGRGRRVPTAVVAGLLGLTGLSLAGFGVVSPLTMVGMAAFTACHFALLERTERPARLRVALAFAFGLVHGFGFAGLLSELGLPVDRRVPALFGFNAGVEIGQLGVVLLVWPALRGLARIHSGRWHRAFAEVGSAAVCALGLFWFLTRTFA